MIIASIIGTALTLGIIILQILLCLGFPLGEYAMGGKYKTYPPAMRIANIFTILLLLSFNTLLLQLCHIIPAFDWSPSAYQTTGYCIGGYLLLNTVMNFCSKSRKEAMVMTPISLITALCFIYSAHNF